MTTLTVQPGYHPDLSSTCAGLRWTTASSLDEAAAVLPDWVRLRSRVGQTTLNNHPDRFAATIRALGSDAQPFIAFGYTDETVRAIILGRRSVRHVHARSGYCTLRFVQLRCLDIVYGGVLTDGTRDMALASAEYLRSLLTSGSGIEHVTLNHLPTDSTLHAALIALPGIITQPADPHWRLSIHAHDSDAILQRASKKHRYNMRRADRLLCDHFGGNVDLQLVTSADQVESFRHAARSIVRASYQGPLGCGFTDSPAQQALLETEAAHGRLRSYLLVANRQPIAFQLGAVHDGIYHLEATAYDAAYSRLSPGSVLFTRVLKDLCAQDVHTIDYGFGDAPYKQMYGAQMHTEQSLHLYGTTLRPQIARSISRAHQLGDRMMRRTLRRCGLDTAVRRMWRSRLQPSTHGEQH